MRSLCFATVGVMVLVLSCSAVHAASVGANQVITLDLSNNPNDDDDSAVILWNTSDQAGEVSIEYLATDPPSDLDAGFLLLDGTMRITTDLVKGSYRLMLIREYDSVRVRRLRQRGRVGSRLRAMRLKREGLRNTWSPARARNRVLKRVERRAAPRSLLRARRQGHLGRRGVFADDSYVWTIVDQAGDFAVGAIPEPASIGCLLAGATALIWRRRRKV